MAKPKPSKSEQKRKHQALQTLGEQLIELDDPQLEELELPERLREAVHDLRKMKSREAIRRQKQFIGKLMGDVDPGPVQALLERLRATERREKRMFANAERWRDRLIREGRSALSELEAATDRRLPELAELLSELSAAHSDRLETTLRRRIFRRVHQALAGPATDS